MQVNASPWAHKADCGTGAGRGWRVLMREVSLLEGDPGERDSAGEGISYRPGTRYSRRFSRQWDCGAVAPRSAVRRHTSVRLSDADRAMLAGVEGPASQLAMRVVVKLAEVAGAEELIDVTSAHIDGCLYHGQSGLDFAERLVL